MREKTPRKRNTRTQKAKVLPSRELQLELNWLDIGELRSRLERFSGLRIQLTLTDNTRSMLSVRREIDYVKVRLHHMFLSADIKVVEALAAWLKTHRAAQPARLVNEFIRSHMHEIRGSVERPEMVTRGNFFDLAAIFAGVNRAYFQDKVTASITWGRMPPLRRRRSIRFGSYTPCDNIIRIHPLLDQEFVPEFFVRYIVFHEMLHAYLGVEETPSGRRRYHTDEFAVAEKEYEDFHRALDWQNTRANLNRLLGCRG